MPMQAARFHQAKDSDSANLYFYIICRVRSLGLVLQSVKKPNSNKNCGHWINFFVAGVLAHQDEHI